MRLSVERRVHLADVLADAFRDHEELDLLLDRLGERLANIASPTSTLPGAIMRLIRWAESTDQVDTLIGAAAQLNPKNIKVKEFAAQVVKELAAPEREFLERIVLSGVPLQETVEWRSRMRQCEQAVCRVESVKGGAREPMGTAFLVGPSAVITNFHVVKDVVAKKLPSSDVVLRFDYKTMEDGVSVRKGRVVKLAGNWKLDTSVEGELDYALLRLAERAGDQPMREGTGASARGWLEPRTHEFEADEPLFILQHPEGKPLKIAVGLTIRTLADHRVEYRVNTEHGSSGSPVFSIAWRLVALHHYGDAVANRGVIFSAILERMRNRDTERFLGT